MAEIWRKTPDFAFTASDYPHLLSVFSIAYAVMSRLGGDTSTLGLFKTIGPLFYLDPPRPLPMYDRAPDLDRAVKDGTVKWVLVRRRDMPTMGPIGGQIEVSETLFSWEGDYEYRNKVVLLRIDPAGTAP